MATKTKDYYDISGFSRMASENEIKKAYRKLARKHHPDLNPGDPAAEEHFKELQKANEVFCQKTAQNQQKPIRKKWAAKSPERSLFKNLRPAVAALNRNRI